MFYLHTLFVIFQHIAEVHLSRRLALLKIKYLNEIHQNLHQYIFHNSITEFIVINDNLIMYLNNGGEPSPDGGGSPSYFVSRRMLMINPVNIKICI